jgi:hypothetical protein
MSVHEGTTIFHLASWKFEWEWNLDNPQWTYRQPLLATMLVMISHPAPMIECPHRVNSFGGCTENYTVMNYIVQFVNRVLRSQSSLSFLVYTFPNMHANSYRSDFFACSCRVNNTEPAVCFTVSLLKAVTQVRSPSVLILTRGYDLFQQWRCQYAWFERQYSANCFRCSVGFNEWSLEVAYFLE